MKTLHGLFENSTLVVDQFIAMNELFSRIEDFLFDILGLVLPGLIFLLILISPYYILDISKIPQNEIDHSYILSGLATVYTILHKQVGINASYTITIFFIFSYITGHLIKVFSIIMYDFLVVIFDKTLNNAISFLFEKIKKFINWIVIGVITRPMYTTSVYKYFKSIFKPIKNTLSKIFTFNPPDYMRENDALRAACINAINSKLGVNYPDEWYSLYKFAKIMNIQENIKSLASNFLARYNLYRSLSFIFIFTTLYFHYFFCASSKFITPELSKISSLILLASMLLWFTFHAKYKKYWTLCGNDTLISLYYFLNKTLLQ